MRTKVFYGYEVDSSRGQYQSWDDLDEEKFDTYEGARKRGKETEDRWKQRGLLDVAFHVVKVTVEEVTDET